MRLGGHGDELLRCLALGPVARIVVGRVQGSGPRDAGAWMAVHAGGLIGTIGGGKLEFDAIADARALLAGQTVQAERRFALGPSLGQCCGGVVWLRYELLQSADAERVRAELLAALQGHMPVALFGGGHVGLAIVSALGALPVRTHWIDSREEVFPVRCR
jgi:xanthine dehydrogenase accessory factor